ncbi:hypothetical protein [Rhodoligotrophos defluvii]|uniref:hypothetical protein n=1 Tax=Rhodoligotrophos defluvii TaxID=2561934 RepID=UPI0010CA0C1C|nr:hypothetical protein [Rhodoligotrophos defluvii]
MSNVISVAGGGIAAEVTGGKFVNGAATAAFAIAGRAMFDGSGSIQTINDVQGEVVIEPAAWHLGAPIVAGAVATVGRSVLAAGTRFLIRLGVMRAPMWSASPSSGLSASQNAAAHFAKHGKQFPQFSTLDDYVEGAHAFFKNPPAGTLTKVRTGGDRLFYHPGSNTFGVQTPYGAPRTFFKPSQGIKYWHRQ